MAAALDGPKLQDDGTPDGWGVKFDQLPVGIRLTTSEVRKMIPQIHEKKVILADGISEAQLGDLQNSVWDWLPFPTLCPITRTTHLDDPHTGSVSLMYCKNVKADSVRSTYFSRLALVVHAYLSILPELIQALPEKKRAYAQAYGEALQTQVDAGKYFDEQGAPLAEVTKPLAELRLLVNGSNSPGDLISQIASKTQSTRMLWRPGNLALVSCHAPHHAGEGTDSDADLYFAQVA